MAAQPALLGHGVGVLAEGVVTNGGGGLGVRGWRRMVAEVWGCVGGDEWWRRRAERVASGEWR